MVFVCLDTLTFVYVCDTIMVKGEWWLNVLALSITFHFTPEKPYQKGGTKVKNFFTKYSQTSSFMEPTNVDFSALITEANQNLNSLNAIKLVVNNYAVEAIPASLKVEDDKRPEAFKELFTKNELFASGLEKLFAGEILFHPGQASLEAFVNGAGAYLERVRSFNTDVKEENPDNDDLILNFIEATNSFAESLDNAIEEVTNEITATTGKVDEQKRDQVKNAIDAQVVIINDEHTNAANALDIVNKQVTLARASKTGEAVFINKITDTIKLINASYTKAQAAQAELKVLNADVDILAAADTKVSDIEGMLTAANDAKTQAAGFADNAIERKFKSALASIKRQFDWINARTEKFATALGKGNKILTEANTIIATEHILCPNRINAIEKAIENITEAQTDLVAVVTDAKSIYDESLVKKADADQLLLDIQSEARNVDQLQKRINRALRSANWNLRRIRAIAGSPNNPREFFGWFGTVNVKQFRGLSWEAQNKRSIFGFGMLIGIALGAFNFGLLINDMKHNPTIAFIAGCCWFIILAALDRIVVMSMDSFDAKSMMEEGGSDDKELTWKDHLTRFFKSKYAFVSLRFLMIIIMTFMVTKVVEMNLFASSVKEQLVQMKAEAIQDVNKKRTARISELNGQKDAAQIAVQPYIRKYKDAIKPFETQVDQQREIVRKDLIVWQYEVDGKDVNGQPTTRGRGDKGVAAAKRAIFKNDSVMLAQLEADLQSKTASLPETADLVIAQKKADAEIDRLNTLIKSETERFDQQTAKVKNASNDGLNERYVALDRVEKQNPIWARVIMAILFILESLPVLGKLMLGKDEYVLAIKSARLEAENRLKLLDMQNETKHFEAIGEQSTKLIPFMNTHNANIETIATNKANHQMNLLNSLAFEGVDFDTKLQLAAERNEQLAELISIQKETQRLNGQLEDSVTNVRNGKKRSA